MMKDKILKYASFLLLSLFVSGLFNSCTSIPASERGMIVLEFNMSRSSYDTVIQTEDFYYEENDFYIKWEDEWVKSTTYKSYELLFVNTATNKKVKKVIRRDTEDDQFVLFAYIPAGEYRFVQLREIRQSFTRSKVDVMGEKQKTQGDMKRLLIFRDSNPWNVTVYPQQVTYWGRIDLSTGKVTLLPLDQEKIDNITAFIQDSEYKDQVSLFLPEK